MNDLIIQVCNSIDEAPVYNGDKIFNGVILKKAVIIRKWTVEGNSTIDLIFEDSDGKKYIAMITGRLIKGIATIIGE
jgi:hypothetical protein